MHITETLAYNRLQTQGASVSKVRQEQTKGVNEKNEAYSTWNKRAGYHGTFARHDTWVRNNAREHAETFLRDRGLHIVRDKFSIRGR
jgi:hypothetical protein